MKTETPKVTRHDRILRLPEVMRLAAASETSIRRWERAGEFPKRIKIGIRMMGWRKSEIDAWIASREPKVGET